MSSPDPEHAPHLPGIPSSEGEKAPPIETVNPLVRLAVQFFVIPMAIVLLCVGLAFVFRWLTWENRDLSSYLDALNSASRSPASKEQEAIKLLNYIQESKRWQGIYDFTEQLRAGREKFLAQHPDFPAKAAGIFEQSKGDDHRVRQYLAQVLGLVGDSSVTPVLIGALQDSDSETVIHSMIALGRIGDPVAIQPLISSSRANDPGIRQTAIFVLGSFKDPAALARCGEALNDSDTLVAWNAAFSMARQGDARASESLERFFDLEYVQRVARTYSPGPAAGAGTGLRPEQVEQYRATAIRLLGKLLPSLPSVQQSEIVNKLKEAVDRDPQVKVRQAAIEAIREVDSKK